MDFELQPVDTHNTDPIPILITAFQMIEHYPHIGQVRGNGAVPYPSLSVYTGEAGELFPTQRQGKPYAADILSIHKNANRNSKYVILSEGEEPPVYINTVDEFLNMIKHTFITNVELFLTSRMKIDLYVCTDADCLPIKDHAAKLIQRGFRNSRKYNLRLDEPYEKWKRGEFYIDDDGKKLSSPERLKVDKKMFQMIEQGLVDTRKSRPIRDIPYTPLSDSTKVRHLFKNPKNSYEMKRFVEKLIELTKNPGTRFSVETMTNMGTDVISVILWNGESFDVYKIIDGRRTKTSFKNIKSLMEEYAQSSIRKLNFGLLSGIPGLNKIIKYLRSL